MSASSNASTEVSLPIVDTNESPKVIEQSKTVVTEKEVKSTSSSKASKDNTTADLLAQLHQAHVALNNGGHAVTKDISGNVVQELKEGKYSLPVGRIKNVMKMDDSVNMISAETPIVFAKACELFIEDLTRRALAFTTSNQRNVMFQEDLVNAIHACDQFDFLEGILPLEEGTHKKRKVNPVIEKKIEVVKEEEVVVEEEAVVVAEQEEVPKENNADNMVDDENYTKIEENKDEQQQQADKDKVKTNKE